MLPLSLSQILSLARSGALGKAWAAFEQDWLESGAENPAALTLKGRLLKDRARIAVEATDRARLFAESAETYSAAAKLNAESYPLINAATMAHLAGKAENARALASDVLAMIEGGTDAAETPYWREATRAEALLLLGRTDEAALALDNATKIAPRAFEDIAATVRQFRMLLEHNKQPAQWLEKHVPANVLYFAGVMGIDPNDAQVSEKIREEVQKIQPAFAFGALAAGADILVAEALRAADCELHIILPCSVEVFRMRSVSAFGEAWGFRFDSLMTDVMSVTVLDSEVELTVAKVAIAADTAMGMAIQKSSLLESVPMALHLGPAHSLSISQYWSARGFVTTQIEVGDLPPVAAANRIAQGEVKALLAIRDQPSPILSEVSSTAFATWAENDCTIMAFEDLSAAHLAHDTLMKSNAVTAAALDIGDLSNGNAAERLSARLCRVLQTAGLHELVGTKAAAMALLLKDRNWRIEPLGEIATHDGACEVFAMHLQAGQ